MREREIGEVRLQNAAGNKLKNLQILPEWKSESCSLDFNRALKVSVAV